MTFRSAIASMPHHEGLTDLSATHRAIRVQGRGTTVWLRSRGVDCPDALFAVHRFGGTDALSLVARIGQADIIVQEQIGGDTIDQLESSLTSAVEVVQVPEQSATFRLSGPHVDTVWRQTCGVQIVERPDDTVIYTRVAGVSCAVIPERRAAERSYSVWVDYSDAPALWKTLAEIFREIGDASSEGLKPGSS